MTVARDHCAKFAPPAMLVFAGPVLVMEGHPVALCLDEVVARRLVELLDQDVFVCDYHKGYDAAMRECESPPPVLLSVRAYNELPADRRAIVDEWLQANGLHVNHVRSVVNATTVKALMLDAHGNIKTTEDGDSAYHLVTVSPFPAGVLAKL